VARGVKRPTAESGPVDGPWELPRGWKWARLGSLVARSPVKHAPNSKSLLPFVGLEHIPPHGFHLSGVGAFCDMRSAASAFEAGDVLYSRLRPYLNKVWLAEFGGACSGELLVLRPSAELRSDYLACLLRGPHFVSFATHAVTGDRPRLDVGEMGRFPVPVPPMDVQGRIVSRIRELFADITDAERAMAGARASTETLRRSLIQSIVSGELTARWRALNAPSEPGTALAARIVAEHERERLKRRGLRQELNVATAPERLPAGWCEAPIGMVAECLDYARVPVSADERTKRPGKVPYYGANGQVGWIDDYIFDETIVLIVEDETFTGREKDFSYVVTGKSWVNNHAHVLRAKRFILPEYLNLALARYPFTPLTTGTTGRKKLTQAALNMAPISIPPLAEQVAALELFSKHLRATTELAAELEAEDANHFALRRSILAAAFRGDLTA
jgi:type I restriction enzyme S subunit